MLALMKKVWRAWKGLAHHIITAQNYILMSLVYVLAVAPVAIVLKLTGHPVVKAPPEPGPDGSFWEPRTDGPMTMERANRMY
ncbi:MAG: hypothetical protein H6741_23130 [Alphaproteobacteria bacterium]|nr:hypothetical protein [Alphaproteobacteria bacterium]